MPRGGQLKAVSNPVCCTDGAWQRGLKEDDKAQDLKELHRSPKSCWAWPITVRWAQSPATPPHCPAQSPVRCATVPCHLPCFGLSQGLCQWHMADWPQATHNRREQLGQSPGLCTSLDRLCSHVLHSRAGMGWGLSLPWEGRAQPCRVVSGLHTQLVPVPWVWT